MMAWTPEAIAVTSIVGAIILIIGIYNIAVVKLFCPERRKKLHRWCRSKCGTEEEEEEEETGASDDGAFDDGNEGGEISTLLSPQNQAIVPAPKNQDSNNEDGEADRLLLPQNQEIPCVPSNQGALTDEPFNQGISDEDFREILSSMSEWYDHHGYINMLKVLYRDLVTEPDKLYAATKVIELFELLCASGQLSSADQTILYDTINVTQPFGLEPEIRKLTTLLNIRTVSISKFTHNRQMLIKVVKSLGDNGVKKISQMYNCPEEADRWELFVDLEQRSIFCEENMDDFMKTITTYLIRERRDQRIGDMDNATREASPRPTTDMQDSDFYIISEDTKWEKQVLQGLQRRKSEVKCLSRMDWQPGKYKLENLIETAKRCKKVVVGFTSQPATGNMGFVSITAVQQMLDNNTLDQAKLIPVRITEDAEIPDYLEPITVANGWEDDFYDKLLNTLSEQDNAPPRQRLTPQQSEDVAIKGYLKTWQRKLYKNVNQMTPPTWNNEYGIDIVQVFTDLDLVKSKKEDEGDQSTTLATSREREAKPTTLPDVLDVIKSTDSCKVLITGKGGMGKTTILRYIAHNWATDKDDTFAGKLLFLINIRDIKAGKNVLHSIMQQISLEDFNLVTDLPEDPRIIKKFIKKHDDEIVLLLDGLDELEPGAESPIYLFKGLELVKSTVILTSRPENTTDFDKSCNVHVTVKGFSPSSIKQYIHKHFKGRPELGESLIQEFRLDSEFNSDSDWEYRHYGGNHKEAFELCSSPFLLLRICTMWKDKQYLPKDMSELFKELTCCILNQYINRSGKGNAISQFEKIPNNYESAILALGKCMYKGLQMNKLSIDKDVLRGRGRDIEDEETVNLALTVGLVYRDKSTCEDDFRKVYTPPHKLISESLAGLYLCKQIQQGSLRSDEYEMIRSNEYLHMTRVFTIGFLGGDAGKLLKHWSINRASNYYSLANYFRYVKNEYGEPVVQELDEHMSTEMKAQCEQMCETFRNVLYIDDDTKATVSKDVHLIQLMSQCCVKYESHLSLLELKIVSMIKKSTELSTEDVCAMLVHILILLEGLYAGGNGRYEQIDYLIFGYLANCEAKVIDILSAKMENLQFKYNLKEFNIHRLKKLSSKFLIHFFKTASELTSLSLISRRLKYVLLNQIFIELNESQVSLKLRKLCLHKYDLSDVGVSLVNLLKIAPNLEELNVHECYSGIIVNTMVTASLANLLKIAPKLKVLIMSKCKLSGTIVNTMTECQSCQTVLELNHLDISYNYLGDASGASFANLFKIAPKLKCVDIRFCDLATTFATEFLNECDTIGVVLKDIMLGLEGNNLSDINGASLAKLVTVIRKDSDWRDPSFKWSDYCLSVDNLQGLINVCCAGGSKLTWERLDLSGFNLASINGITLACLFKISPRLKHLKVNNCNLSGSSMNSVLNECDKIGVVLQDNMLSLKGNNLSDINGASLAKLVTVICKDSDLRDPSFKWSDYCLSVDNLQDLINVCRAGGSKLTWERLDLSGFNLASVNGITLACLFKISPRLKHLKINNCNLSGSSMSSVLNECDKIGVVLEDNVLSLKGNDLSDIDGVSLAKLVRMICMDDDFRELFIYSDPSFIWSDYCLSVDNLQDLINVCGADGGLTWERLDLRGINLASINGITSACLFKISPELEHLGLNNCNLSGSNISSALNECDKIGVVLEDNMLSLKGNDLSDIDGASLAKLVRMICMDDDFREFYSDSDPSFIWSDYCLSVDNLQDLINVCGADGRLTWERLDLSGINLASINGITLACLFKISPGLEHLGMNNCNLSGSSMSNVLNECDKIGVVLQDNMLSLKGNDLSDIDGASLAKLVTVICKDGDSRDPSFKWSDYCLSVGNLQDLINVCGANGGLTWKMLDLSGINLASVNEITLVSLFKISPQLKRLKINNCNLSGSSMSSVLNECDKIGVVLQGNMLSLKGNDLSDIDGVSLAKLVRMICMDDDFREHIYSYSDPSFIWSDYCLSVDNLQDLINVCGADGLTWEWLDLSGINLISINRITLACLFKISPGLKYLEMNNCNLSGSSMSNVLNECDKIGVELTAIRLSLKGNDLSDIDGVSLAKLVRMICMDDYFRKFYSDSDPSFKWSDYCLSVNNLQDLINVCVANDRLTWGRLDFSGINLASMNGITLACLFKFSPELNHLDMSNCNLSGSGMRNVLNKCDKIGVVLENNMLCLKNNDLSDIDGVSLAKLLRVIDDSPLNCNSYCLTVDNLQDLVSSLGEDDITVLKLNEIDLSSINLSELTPAMFLSLIGALGILNHLIMRDCSLVNNVLQDLIQMLSDNCVKLALTELDIGNNDLVGFSALSLTSLLSIFPNLQQLNMSKCHLQSNVLHDMVRICEESNIVLRITDLVLSGNDFSSLNGTTVAALPICLPNLKHLDMSHCSLSSSIMEDLSRVSSDRNALMALTNIKLCGNDFSVLNKIMITAFSTFVPKLQQLEMRRCNLSFSIVQHLLKVCSEIDIMTELTRLTSISLGENDLGDLNWSSIASYISKRSKLEILKIHDCHLSSNILHEIANDLSNRHIVLKLTHVDLSNNDLSNLGGASLVRLVRAVPKLRGFKMSNCSLKGNDVHALVKAFSDAGFRYKLRVVNLSNNNLSDINGASLSLLCNSFVSGGNLDLSSCQLNDDILLNMADSLQYYKLHTLTISDNNIVDKSRIERELRPLTHQLKLVSS